MVKSYNWYISLCKYCKHVNLLTHILMVMCQDHSMEPLSGQQCTLEVKWTNDKMKMWSLLKNINPFSVQPQEYNMKMRGQYIICKSWSRQLEAKTLRYLKCYCVKWSVRNFNTLACIIWTFLNGLRHVLWL